MSKIRLYVTAKSPQTALLKLFKMDNTYVTPEDAKADLAQFGPSYHRIFAFAFEVDEFNV